MGKENGRAQDLKGVNPQMKNQDLMMHVSNQPEKKLLPPLVHLVG
jgi:hypothetical protein